jgi:hypothetical protein
MWNTQNGFFEIHSISEMSENKTVSKVELSHYRHAGKEVWLLLILDLSTRWGERSASCPGYDLSPGKDLRYQLDRRLDGPQSWFGHTVQREKSFVFDEHQTPVIQSVVRYYTD